MGAGPFDTMICIGSRCVAFDPAGGLVLMTCPFGTVLLGCITCRNVRQPCCCSAATASLYVLPLTSGTRIDFGPGESMRVTVVVGPVTLLAGGFVDSTWPGWSDAGRLRVAGVAVKP